MLIVRVLPVCGRGYLVGLVIVSATVLTVPAVTSAIVENEVSGSSPGSGKVLLRFSVRKLSVEARSL